MKKTKLTLMFGLGVMIFSLGVTLWSARRQQAEVLHEHLLSRLPKAVDGWDVKEIPIASSEEMKKAVGEMLNYSDAIFREYSRGGKSISIYAAYWKPRKFNPRLIADHTPDVCWVGNGWKMEKEDYNYAVALPAGSAWPAQYRELSLSGITTYVLYWHIVSGKLSGYASGPGSRSNSFLANFMTDIKAGSGEQFFIRISSQNPWAEWSADPLFKEILKTFSPVISADMK